jgi:hypothetical protein
MIIRIFSVLLVSLIVLLGACQSVGNKGDGDKSSSFKSVSTEGMESACFYWREVSDWEALNEVNIIVYVGNKSRAYLLTISPPAVSLRGSSDIGFTGVRDRVCGRSGERLVVGRGNRSEYTVMDVRRLDAATLAGLLQNKHAVDSKNIEPAAESPGAQIETDIKPNEGEGK